MNTLETLQSLLAESYKLAPERVTADATLETLGVDSLGLLEVLFEIEDRFGIQVPTERPELHTVGEVAGYIDRLVAEQRVGAKRDPARQGVGPRNADHRDDPA